MSAAGMTMMYQIRDGAQLDTAATCWRSKYKATGIAIVKSRYRGAAA